MVNDREIPEHVRRIHELTAEEARRELEDTLRVLHHVVTYDLHSIRDTGYEEFRRDAARIGREHLIESQWWDREIIDLGWRGRLRRALIG